MPYFTSPTRVAVQNEVKLRPEQVRSTFSSGDYDSDVDDRISEEAAFVDQKLYTGFQDSDLDSLTTNQQALATKATELRVAASLYHTAGQLNEAYKAEALDYERRANEYLGVLLDSIGSRVESLDSTATFSNTPTRVDGYTGSATEYTP